MVSLCPQWAPLWSAGSSGAAQLEAVPGAVGSTTFTRSAPSPPSSHHLGLATFKVSSRIKHWQTLFALVPRMYSFIQQHYRGFSELGNIRSTCSWHLPLSIHLQTPQFLPPSVHLSCVEHTHAVCLQHWCLCSCPNNCAKHTPEQPLGKETSGTLYRAQTFTALHYCSTALKTQSCSAMAHQFSFCSYFLDTKGWYGGRLLVETGFYRKEVGSDVRTAGNKPTVFQKWSMFQINLQNKTGNTTRWHNGVLHSNLPFRLSYSRPI